MQKGCIDESKCYTNTIPITHLEQFNKIEFCYVGRLAAIENLSKKLVQILIPALLFVLSGSIFGQFRPLGSYGVSLSFKNILNSSAAMPLRLKYAA